MQRSHVTLIESTLKRLEFSAPESALMPLKDVLERAHMQGGEYFNVSGIGTHTYIPFTEPAP